MTPVNNIRIHDAKKTRLGRRSFLKSAASFLCGTTLMKWGIFPVKSWGASLSVAGSSDKHEKLIFIAIDSLDPKYLDLDSRGMPGGHDGNWLMPNIRSFLKQSRWYKNAKAYLPAATDMNHLNALAGTSSAQTGIIGVWAQPTGWDKTGHAVIKRTGMSLAKDDLGRPVDTLFKAWKRRWPDSKTMLISGKGWVVDMFRQDGSASGIDIMVTGTSHPAYLHPPKKGSFADPDTDEDAACDPESSRLGELGDSISSDVMTRLYTGQGSLLTLQMENYPQHFPRDGWIVDSTLEIFKRENPDMAYILLAECDDAGHCIGSAGNPAEFISAHPAHEIPKGCENKPEYQLVSHRNRLLFKEAILDVIRDVDIQFGRLIKGMEEKNILSNATIILLSDHSMTNHIYSEDFSSTDFVGLLEKTGIVKNQTKKDFYAFAASSYGAIYWREHKENISKAKKLLQAHKALNPETGKKECPWWVLDRKDMKSGVEGVCLPGELYHTHYVETDKEKSIIWPDLIILGKNGWQMPVYNGLLPNIGIEVPSWSPPWRVFNSGHGSVDTLPIVAAISTPGGQTGAQEKPIRIADIGITAASLFGLSLNSTTVGKNLRDDLIRNK